MYADSAVSTAHTSTIASSEFELQALVTTLKEGCENNDLGMNENRTKFLFLVLDILVSRYIGYISSYTIIHLIKILWGKKMFSYLSLSSGNPRTNGSLHVAPFSLTVFEYRLNQYMHLKKYGDF